MVVKYIEERKTEQINILIIFLLGIAAALFLIASIQSFQMSSLLKIILITSTSFLYIIAAVAFLWPRKIKTPIEIEPKIIEKTVFRNVEKPVIRYIKQPQKNEKEQPQKKEIQKVALVEVEKRKESKPKYVGSINNEKYHLRTCKFSKLIKKKYLIEEDDKKFFELRGYQPCKNCKPDKN